MRCRSWTGAFRQTYAGRCIAAEHRIDGSELEQRNEGAWSARTRADLDAVTHDLPRPRRRRRQVPAWQLPIFPLIPLARAGRARIRRRKRRRLERT